MTKRTCFTCRYMPSPSGVEPCRSCAAVTLAADGDNSAGAYPGWEPRPNDCTPEALAFLVEPTARKVKETRPAPIGHNGGPALDCGGTMCHDLDCPSCHPPLAARYGLKVDADGAITGYRAKPAETTVNPKELAGAKKPPTWSVMPRWVSLLMGRVMAVGAAKYGAFNYRDTKIAASTYQDAMERHAQLWFDGEDNDPETGVSHLASIMTSCALLLDAQASGKLDDDRQKTGLARKALDDLAEVMKALPLPARQA